jgi:hypothetical protein
VSRSCGEECGVERGKVLDLSDEEKRKNKRRGEEGKERSGEV